MTVSLERQIIYPDSDGQPMADNTKQFRWIVLLKENIEVIITSGDINILEIYRRIGIPEVWFYKNSILTIYSIQNEEYLKVDHSLLLPELNLENFIKNVNYPDQYDALTDFVNSLN